jgi:putative addiction module component (TIGR02574 family)
MSCRFSLNETGLLQSETQIRLEYPPPQWSYHSQHERGARDSHRVRDSPSQGTGVMSRGFKDIVAEVLDLPLRARAELASELLDSLDDLSEEENEQLWIEEAERRFAEYKAGRIDTVPAEEVFARLRSRTR